MEHDVVRDIASSLRVGKITPADPRDVDAAVRSIADGLARGEGKDEDLWKAMKALNGQRQFAHTRTLGKAWIDLRPFDPLVTKHYAQALIDLFELDPAESLLNAALVAARKSSGAQAASQVAEYLGLLGRIEKQRFVATGDKDRLVAATDRYLAQLDSERNSPEWFWHGINAVALAAREKREGVTPPPRKTRVEADEILARMRELHVETPDNPWVPATASEACLALGECDDAELWLYRFLHHPNAEPFNIQSYDRQLREIWQGNPMGDGTRCADRLARIVARHTMRTQSQLTITPAAIPDIKEALERTSPEGLEKNFLGESTFSLANIKDMLAACSSIGCVTNKSGARLGTGFLVDGSWLGACLSGPVFVTNAHVISATVPKAIAPADARVSFEVESEEAGVPLFYKVADVLFTSPPEKLGTSRDDALDVSVVTLQPMGDAQRKLAPLRYAQALPKIENQAKAYVIGHPLGSGLQISLHDSLLLDIDGPQRLVHYRTPTDPGSSGSPVFNSDWEVIGLHHGGSEKTPRLHGSGDYEANEAISLLAIREHLCAKR